MGRTKRKRSRRKLKENVDNSTHDIIYLTKWMGTVKWKNLARVKCRQFNQTGRGVTSSKNIRCGEVLMQVPYELLITYPRIVECDEFMYIFLLNSKLRIQDLLSVFLVIEKHKDDKSCWKYYIASLPQKEPQLPWASSLEQIQYYPEECKSICEKCKFNFQESWQRLKDSLNLNWICTCCNKKIYDILNLKSYLWGYTMVNTRGVYIDPDIMRSFAASDMLLDEPNIGLCPLMDMFNHSDTSENKTELTCTPQGSVYELITFKNFQKHDQIFISYGRHDNLKLFTEYGFYLQKNCNDKIKFKPDEILKVLNFKLSKNQYGFLKQHEFLNRDELFISWEGLSFKLKGFLYVACNDGEKNYSVNIFGEKYDNTFMEILKHFILKLINYKKDEYKRDIERFDEKFSEKNILNFLNNRLKFVESLEHIHDLY